MKVRAFLVEDEPLARQTLHDFCREFDWLEIVGEAADGATALAQIRALKPALVFLDVQIPELGGIEVLRRLEDKPAIVFTTAFDRYAMTAFEFEAVDYLQKPFGRERFRQTVERVQRRLAIHDSPNEPENSLARVEPPVLQNNLLELIFVRANGKLVPIKIVDVLCLIAEDDYTRVRTTEKSYLVNTTLGEFAERLPAAQFCRVHRAAIVNLKHIRVLEPHDRRFLLRLSDNFEIVASRAGSQFLRNLIV